MLGCDLVDERVGAVACDEDSVVVLESILAAEMIPDDAGAGFYVVRVVDAGRAAAGAIIGGSVRGELKGLISWVGGPISQTGLMRE